MRLWHINEQFLNNIKCNDFISEMYSKCVIFNLLLSVNVFVVKGGVWMQSDVYGNDVHHDSKGITFKAVKTLVKDGIIKSNLIPAFAAGFLGTDCRFRLCSGLLDIRETPSAVEYDHRCNSRGDAAADRLGCYRSESPSSGLGDVRCNVPLAAAAFLCIGDQKER